MSHKEAFDLLQSEAWRPEEAAMGNSNLPTVLDKLCMVANIHTRMLIDELKDQIKDLDPRIQALTDKINSLEEKTNVAGARIQGWR